MNIKTIALISAMLASSAAFAQTEPAHVGQSGTGAANSGVAAPMQGTPSTKNDNGDSAAAINSSSMKTPSKSKHSSSKHNKSTAAAAAQASSMAGADGAAGAMTAKDAPGATKPAGQ